MFAVAEDQPTADPQWLRELNPEQRSAVRHPGGPLLILAGAGTGKTTTLCARVAWLVAEGMRAGADPAAHLHPSRRAGDARAGPRAGLDARGPAGDVSAAPSTRSHTGSYACTQRSLGLAPGFGVLDAGDAADLIDLIREEHGHATAP